METGPERGAVPPAGQGCGGRARRPRASGGTTQHLANGNSKTSQTPTSLFRNWGNRVNEKTEPQGSPSVGTPGGPLAQSTAPSSRRARAVSGPVPARGAWGRLTAGRTPGPPHQAGSQRRRPGASPRLAAQRPLGALPTTSGAGRLGGLHGRKGAAGPPRAPPTPTARLRALGRSGDPGHRPDADPTPACGGPAASGLCPGCTQGRRSARGRSGLGEEPARG